MGDVVRVELVPYANKPSDKSSWGNGPWQSEDDLYTWTEGGLPCAVMRMSHSGGLNGYVGVPKGHPLFGTHYDRLDVDVHGGLTYGDHPSKDGEWWWFGFDTTHLGDLMPALMVKGFGSGGVYCDARYVKGQTSNLARQLSKIGAAATGSAGE